MSLGSTFGTTGAGACAGASVGVDDGVVVCGSDGVGDRTGVIVCDGASDGDGDSTGVIVCDSGGDGAGDMRFKPPTPLLGPRFPFLR